MMEMNHIAFVGPAGSGKTYQLHRMFTEIRNRSEVGQMIFIPDPDHADNSLEGAIKRVWTGEKELVAELIQWVDQSIQPVIFFIDTLPVEAVSLSPLFCHPRSQVVMTTQLPSQIDEIQTESLIQIKYLGKSSHFTTHV